MSIHAEHFRRKREQGGESRGVLSPMSARAMRELLAPELPSAYVPGSSVTLLRKCPHCGEWARAGSAAAGACVDCGTPL